jgi:anosmin-1
LKLQPGEEIPHRQAIIQWEMPEDLNQYSQIFSVVQSRSHIGNEFSEAKLNKFHPHMVLNYYEEKTAKHRLYAGIVKLNPGRWYQFRVAAVNEFGTMGYSNYTKEFQLTKSK